MMFLAMMDNIILNMCHIWERNISMISYQLIVICVYG
jgi:hypothetical protein